MPDYSLERSLWDVWMLTRSGEGGGLLILISININIIFGEFNNNLRVYTPFSSDISKVGINEINVDRYQSKLYIVKTRDSIEKTSL